MKNNAMILLTTLTTESTEPTVPAFVQSTINLLQDAFTWLLAISGVAAVFFLGWNIFKWYTAGENEKPAEMKKIKQVAIGAVAIVVIEALVTLLLSYYAV